MKVKIEHLSCGMPGTIIDCFQHASFQCAFCKEYNNWFSEVRDITPIELVKLIEENKFIIRTI